MLFHEYLKRLKAQNNFHSNRELFDHFGGETKLGISYPSFKQIMVGARPPTPKTLNAIAASVPSSDLKEVTIAFFESFFGKVDLTKNIIVEYLNDYLHHNISKMKKSAWEGHKNVMYFTEKQMAYLSNNHTAIGIHKNVLLYEKVPKSTVDEKIKNELIELYLIKEEGDFVVPTSTLYKIPQFKTAPPSVVSNATELRLQQVRAFISMEGSENQLLGYTTQLVNEKYVEKITNDLVYFKNWIRSMAAGPEDKDAVPMTYFSFFKKLTSGELS